MLIFFSPPLLFLTIFRIKKEISIYHFCLKNYEILLTGTPAGKNLSRLATGIMKQSLSSIFNWDISAFGTGSREIGFRVRLAYPPTSLKLT